MNQLSDNAIITLNKRYFLKDKEGNIVENWKGLCRRVAKAIALDEDKEDVTTWAKVYSDLIEGLYFIPNTPTLMNAGKKGGQLAACFVLGIEDNMVSIMDTAKDAALIHKSGGGTGFDFSNLRPSDSIVSTTAGTASGPVSFMEMYDGITEKVKQGGTRRGANMGILRVDHPDILKFIDCKQNVDEITNFNISIAITDDFMKAVKDNKEYDLIDPKTKQVVKKLNAKTVFNKIVDNAWQTGEPGLFFIDTANKTNGYGIIYATNPCGEQPLRNNEACNLGSINLVKFIDSAGNFLWDIFIDCVSTAVRFLDSVISMNNYPLDIIKKTHAETRKIGLGVMGFADALIKMGIEYGSQESFDFADKMFGLLTRQSKLTSELLGKEKGVCVASKKYRNYWTNTIAPTGTISIIAGCSSGIEPNFSVAFLRKILDGETLVEINPVFKELMEQEGVEITKEMEEELLSASSLKDVKGVPTKIKKLFKTASDVTPTEHVQMQAVFQKHSDSGVSKTINMDESAKKSDVAKAYFQAWETGCKGITVYRDGSRPNQPMSNKKEERNRKTFNRTTTMSGSTEKIRTPLGNLYLTINNHAHGEPGELILNIGKTGADIRSFAECIARLVSVALQYGMPPHKIAEQMMGLKGEEYIMHDEKRYLSIPDVIGRKLNQATKEKTKDKDIAMQKCPMCQGKLYQAEGCKTCLCGYSKC